MNGVNVSENHQRQPSQNVKMKHQEIIPEHFFTKANVVAGEFHCEDVSRQQIYQKNYHLFLLCCNQNHYSNASNQPDQKAEKSILFQFCFGVEKSVFIASVAVLYKFEHFISP